MRIDLVAFVVQQEYVGEPEIDREFRLLKTIDVALGLIAPSYGAALYGELKMLRAILDCVVNIFGVDWDGPGQRIEIGVSVP